jgi:hypothetical protein
MLGSGVRAPAAVWRDAAESVARAGAAASGGGGGSTSGSSSKRGAGAADAAAVAASASILAAAAAAAAPADLFDELIVGAVHWAQTRIYPRFLASGCWTLYAAMQFFAFTRAPLTRESFHWIKVRLQGG